MGWPIPTKNDDDDDGNSYNNNHTNSNDNGGNLLLYQDEEREDCYEARLTVRGVQKGDSRRFSLNVTNDRGTVEHTVELDVRGKLPPPSSSSR